MIKPLQVLLVEDNAGDARLLHEMFRKEKAGSVVLTHLLRMTEAVARLEKGGVDILLLDMGLPDGHGLDTVRRAQAVAPHVPVIVLTGLDDEALAAQAMKEGAQDYLIKGQIESRALPRALRHAIERHRMQEEAELIRVNQLQFKDKFLSHVSHELRSPLNAIYQFVTILFDRIGGELTSDQHEYLGIILRNVKQLQAMIDDLLEVTRVQGGQLAIDLQCTSVSDVIEFAVSTLRGAAHAKEITLTVEWGDNRRWYVLTQRGVRQIFIILLDNAIKFTPPGGSVRVRAGARTEDPNTLVLEILDSGCGIDPAMTERIFDRLFQASDPALAGRQGLGLGLYICKELVTRQGGRIWASGTPGMGAVLSFTLPMFSMQNLLAATLGDIATTRSPVTLVLTEMGSQSGWLSEEARAEHSHGVRELLQCCLHADQDVLLPKMGTSGSSELFFIVAATGPEGGESLARRIQRRFDNRDPALRVGLVLSTSFHSLRWVEHAVNAARGAPFEEMAEAIHSMVKEELSSRWWPMANKKILIVDDDPDVRQAMHIRLKAHSYDTCFAFDAISSLTEARKQQPDLIILDLGLPGGDGYVVMERLKRHPTLSVIPIIVVSARDALGNQERVIAAGAKVYLQKPANNAELLAIIRQTLGQPEQPGDAGVPGKLEAIGGGDLMETKCLCLCWDNLELYAGK